MKALLFVISIFYIFGPQKGISSSTELFEILTPDQAYEIGLKYRKGTMPGFSVDTPRTYDQAVLYFTKATQSQNRELIPKAYHNLAMIEYKRKVFDQALQDFAYAWVNFHFSRSGKNLKVMLKEKGSSYDFSSSIAEFMQKHLEDSDKKAHYAEKLGCYRGACTRDERKIKKDEILDLALLDKTACFLGQHHKDFLQLYQKFLKEEETKVASIFKLFAELVSYGLSPKDLPCFMERELKRSQFYNQHDWIKNVKDIIEKFEVFMSYVETKTSS